MVSIEIPESLETKIEETLSETRYDSRKTLIEDAPHSGLESVKENEDTLGDILERSAKIEGWDR